MTATNAPPNRLSFRGMSGAAATWTRNLAAYNSARDSGFARSFAAAAPE